MIDLSWLAAVEVKHGVPKRLHVGESIKADVVKSRSLTDLLISIIIYR